MNWNSETVRRACFVLDNLAMEIVNHEELGMKVVVITDCLDETQKAMFTMWRGRPKEKMSSFRSHERNLDVTWFMKNNADHLWEIMNE
ncbi:MAG: hypothetical protein FWG68_02660 [Defluviitaleaceae bacterium]|nr:hypothetical protein [Defluviitaleaceae bacterium]